MSAAPNRSGRRPVRYSTPPRSTASPRQSPSNTVAKRVEDSPRKQGQDVFQASGRTIYSPDAQKHKFGEDCVKLSLANLSLLEMCLEHGSKEDNTANFQQLKGCLTDDSDSGESVTTPHGLMSGSHDPMFVEDLNKAVDDLFKAYIDTTD